MRLSPSQIQAIVDSTGANFGNDAQVWLFGSRVDDHLKGGDIDLYIEIFKQAPADLITCKLKFMRDLHKKLGQQKIDVVLNKVSHSADLPIYQIAKQTGIQLQ